MTYEEYKSSNKKKKNNYIKVFMSKLFTIVIFSMLVIICSNYFPSFKNFLIDDVLNKTMDFSKVNSIMDKFKPNKEVSVFKEEDERYKDGYKIKGNEVKLKSSGIVVFIGEKDDYGNTIVVQQSDGYYAWYGNIKEEVKLYDYIESGSLVGTSEDFYYYVLYKDDKPVLNENQYN